MLLVVLDTVRADAVSAYGGVEGTTPTFDDLASKGIRYARAYAPAPWTLPSHATLFTGRLIDEHHVAMPGHAGLPSDFETLAGMLADAGYDTAAFSENAIVSDIFGLLRGFNVRKTTTLSTDGEEQSIDGSVSFRQWLEGRDSDGPFFAFVNLLDAHRPYLIRPRNPWVPKDARAWEVRDRHRAPERQICGALPTPKQLAIQRGLYLGDVHEADRKLGRILAAARSAMSGAPLITVVTSDHGELFGEHQLLGHEFSLHNRLLHVPLVVAGVALDSSTVIEAPVGLEDLMPTMLEWAGVMPPSNLRGHSLPLSEPVAPRDDHRFFFSAYTDQFVSVPPQWRDRVGHADKNALRQFCSGSNRVFGAMASIIRYPFKYVWYERYPASLYDLSWDPEERSDQLKYHPELARSLADELAVFRDASRVLSEADQSGSDLSRDEIDALKQLGYVE